MTRFRIYTENTNLPHIIKLSRAISDAFTVYHTTGFWKSSQERSLIIELIGSSLLRRKVKRLAQSIKRENSQEAVLVTSEFIHGGLI